MSAAPEAEHWQDLAACRGADADLFFPISDSGPSHRQIDRAIDVCQACPVRRPCLLYAVSLPRVYGIWGGTTEAQRNRLRRRRTGTRSPAPPARRGSRPPR